MTQRKRGRIAKPLDWQKVDELLMAGCTAHEIAPHFDMFHETLRQRVEKEHGMQWVEYVAMKRAKGDSLLRCKQFSKALKGDNTLLIWLGRNRLKQSEGQTEHNQNPELIKHFKSMISLLESKQQDAIEGPISQELSEQSYEAENNSSYTSENDYSSLADNIDDMSQMTE